MSTNLNHSEMWDMKCVQSFKRTQKSMCNYIKQNWIDRQKIIQQKSIVVPQNEVQLKSINQHGQASSLPVQLLVNAYLLLISNQPIIWKKLTLLNLCHKELKRFRGQNGSNPILHSKKCWVTKTLLGYLATRWVNIGQNTCWVILTHAAC